LLESVDCDALALALRRECIGMGGQTFHRRHLTAGRMKLVRRVWHHDPSERDCQIARLLLHDEEGNAPSLGLLRENPKIAAAVAGEAVEAAQAASGAVADARRRQLEREVVRRACERRPSRPQHRSLARRRGAGRPKGTRRSGTRSGGSRGDPHLGDDDPPGERPRPFDDYVGVPLAVVA